MNGQWKSTQAKRKTDEVTLCACVCVRVGFSSRLFISGIQAADPQQSPQKLQ